MKEKIFDVIVAPLYTEKATYIGALSKYVFRVAKDASKLQIKQAFKQLFDLDVLKINIINTKPKTKIFKGRKGVRSGYKKAIITVAEGKVLDFIVGA